PPPLCRPRPATTTVVPTASYATRLAHPSPPGPACDTPLVGVRSGCAPGSRLVGAADLAHELRLVETQAEHRDPQHGATQEDELVLSQRIHDRVEPFEVMAAVDLDNEVEVVPVDVEVDPTIRQLSDHL